MKWSCALLLLLAPLFARAAETVRCNETSFHELALSAPAATFDVALKRGDIVAVTMRPLAATLRSITLSLVPPAGASPAPPSVSGGSDGTIRYIPPADGTYQIVAGAGTERQSGPYALNVTCGVPRNASVSRDCVRQYLVCGQTGRWQLLDTSCALDSGFPGNPYFIHVAPGDEVTWELRSTAFPPDLRLLNVFGEQVSAATTRSGDLAILTFKAQVERDLFLYATTDVAAGRGAYELTLSCNTSGCLIPIIIDPPHDMAVPYGTRAQLTVQVDAKGPVVYEWLDAEGLPTLVGQARDFVTPPVTRRQAYYVHVVTPCGETMSNVVYVTPLPDHRRRARR